MGSRLRTLLFALLTAGSPLAAQISETLQVTQVEVPVTVVDRSGRPVRGLTARNFRLIDDGVPRAVESFDAIDFAASGEGPVVSPLHPSARRAFLLLFDLSFSSPVAIGRAQQAARDFIRLSIQRRDHVAVAAIDAHRGLRFLTSFTTDRQLLSAAIADPRAFQSRDPLQIAGAALAEPVAAPTTAVADRVDKTDDLLADIARGTERLDDAYRRQRIDRQIGLLAQLARTLRAVSGQKHVVLLSEGFDPRLVQGRGVDAIAEQAEENDAIERGEVWKVDSDYRYGNATSLSILDGMARMFRRSDVVLHALDIKGVRAGTDVRSGSGRDSNESLFLLANATGGDVIRNSNDLSAGLSDMLERREVVYVLGFRAPSSKPGAFHSLKVRLVDVPGRPAVNHRSGYYEPGAANMIERSLTNAEIVLNDIPQTALRVATIATAFPTRSENSQVPVIVDIEGGDLLARAGGSSAVVEIFTYAFDAEGLVRDRMDQRVTLDLQKVSERLRAGGLKYCATLSLPPGSYAVRTLVRMGNANGFSRIDLRVPGNDDVGISSPLMFDPPGEWILVRGGSHDSTNAPYPFVFNGEPFVPSATARLSSGNPSRFAVFVTNAAADEMTWETSPPARIVSRFNSETGSKVLFELEREAHAEWLEVRARKSGSADERRSAIPVMPDLKERPVVRR